MTKPEQPLPDEWVAIFDDLVRVQQHTERERDELRAEIERLRARLTAAERLIEVVRARQIGTAGGVGAAFEAYDALGNSMGLRVSNHV